MSRLYIDCFFTLKFAQIVSVLMLSIIIANNSVLSQTQSDLPESLRGALGLYEINVNEKPEGFKTFRYFQLKEFPRQDTHNPVKDEDGRVYVSGKIKTTDNIDFQFTKAFVKAIDKGEDEFYKEIAFKTITVSGYSYEFEGEFLERMILERGRYTVIKGKLTKYKNGKKVSHAELSFTENAEL